MHVLHAEGCWVDRVSAWDFDWIDKVPDTCHVARRDQQTIEIVADQLRRCADALEEFRLAVRCDRASSMAASRRHLAQLLEQEPLHSSLAGPAVRKQFKGSGSPISSAVQQVKRSIETIVAADDQVERETGVRGTALEHLRTDSRFCLLEEVLFRTGQRRSDIAEGGVETVGVDQDAFALDLVADLAHLAAGVAPGLCGVAEVDADLLGPVLTQMRGCMEVDRGTLVPSFQALTLALHTATGSNHRRHQTMVQQAQDVAAVLRYARSLPLATPQAGSAALLARALGPAGLPSFQEAVSRLGARIALDPVEHALRRNLQTAQDTSYKPTVMDTSSGASWNERRKTRAAAMKSARAAMDLAEGELRSMYFAGVVAADKLNAEDFFVELEALKQATDNEINVVIDSCGTVIRGRADMSIDAQIRRIALTEAKFDLVRVWGDTARKYTAVKGFSHSDIQLIHVVSHLEHTIRKQVEASVRQTGVFDDIEYKRVVTSLTGHLRETLDLNQATLKRDREDVIAGVNDLCDAIIATLPDRLERPIAYVRDAKTLAVLADQSLVGRFPALGTR